MGTFVHVQGANGAELPSSTQSFPSPGGWPIPAATLIPAPALGLLSSAIAVPSLLLGSFLEANGSFPDFASLARSPALMDPPPTSTTSLVASSEHFAPRTFSLGDSVCHCATVLLSPY